MDTPPRSATESGRRHIPAEVVSEILWKLPVKSLLRFSSVSTSWHLIINQPYFSSKYRGRQRMIFRYPNSGGFRICHLSAAVSNDPIATHLDVFNFDGNIEIRAVCNGLCFLEDKSNLGLFIWNPSNRKFHQLPLYPFPTAQRQRYWPLNFYCEVYYGLGFDLIGDDYKLLGILKHEAALYSLRSNSWRKIQSFPKIDMWSRRGTSCYVNGAFYWPCYDCVSGHIIIVSFDLSKEEYGEVALPPEYVSPNHEADTEELCVLRGKLCLSINYRKIEKRQFVLWVMEMEDDGVWTKKFDIGYGVFNSRCIAPVLTPLCRFDDDDGEGEEAICVTSQAGESWVILRNKDGKTIVKKNFGREDIYRNDGFVYVESLVSPAALVTSHHNKEG